MADTTVNVTIRAQVAGYLQGMNQVAQATQQANTAAQNLQAQGAAMEKVGRVFLTIGAAAAAGVALAVKKFADFDAQMSQVQSLSHATAAEMDTLRNAALTMGQGIGFSATQVAEAETELVKAGVGVKDIMGGALKGALDLAAAGQINVADATEIAATAMTQFGLAGKDIPHVADLLAAGADKSLGGVEELGMALKQSGLVANQFGLTVDQTVGTLAEFASAGLMGSDAGTSLKQMFLQLATPTKQAQQAMEKYHISAYDAQGDFVGMTALAGQLQAGFKGVDDASRDSALGIIFGSDAIRAANILYTDGAKGNREWTNSVNEAGFAAQQAAGKTDNLNGDVKKLGAAFETGLIRSGSASNSVLREMVQSVTGMVAAYANAPGAVQAVVLALGAATAATALAGGGFLTLVPKVAAARAAMQEMNLTTGRIAKGFAAGGAVALGIYAISAGIAGMGREAELTQTQLAKLNAAMTSNSKGALDKQFTGKGVSAGRGAFTAQIEGARTAKQALDALNSSSGQWTKNLGGAVDGIFHTDTSGTIKRFAAQFKQMGTTLATTAETDVASASAGFNKLLKNMGGGQETARNLLNSMEPYKAELIELAGAQGKTLSEQELLNLAQGKGKTAAELAAVSTQKQKEQLAELSGVASQANQEIGQLADAIRDFGSTQLSVEQTESDFQAAIDDATAALKENGKVLTANGDAIDLNSDKGRANAAALRQIAQDGVAATAAIVENGGSQADAASKMQTTRDAYIKAAQAFGLSGDEAAKMADQLRLVPENVSTLFKQQGADDVSSKAKQVKGDVDRVPSAKETKLRGDLSDAKAKLSGLKGQLASVPKSKSTKLNAEVAAARAAVQDLQRQINALPASKTTTLTTVNRTVAQNVTAGNTAFASGGHVRGPGSGTSDSIPAMLSNGEYVIRAASVQKYGQHTFDRLNAGHYADGGLVQHFASGGGVQYQYEKAAGNFNGLQGVSQLNSMFGDGSLSIALRNQAGLAALSYQRSLTGLTNASDKAASKLTDLQGSAASLKSSVASAVGNFDVGNYRSASSLSRGLSKSAGQVKEFAGLLTTLSKKGVSGALLSEIASLGTAEGLPLARSLAAASASDIKSINSSYASIQSTAAKAGQTVADANYKAQIAAADKNARSLEAQIARQSVAIQRIIARGFGVKGYASGGYTGELGTGAVAGVVHGREFVVNAAATARNRMILEAMNAGGNVRYMSAERAPAATAPQPVVNRQGNTYNLSVQDPTAVAQAIERRERAEYV